jgi:SAM-dependent methyltransferase
MKAAVSQQPIYALGDSEQELRRLVRQGEVFAPFTRQLFQQSGIGPGMRVLDAGCGAGDVTFLASESAGPRGEVVGADISSSAVEWARHRAAREGIGNVKFVIGDPALMKFDEEFDALVGRVVLMYYPDPVEALRMLANHVRPGGIIAFQEFDMSNMRSFPPTPTFERAATLMRQVLTSTGARVNIGLELTSIFLDAGLPEPSLRMDAVVGGASQFPYGIVAATLHSLLPTIQRLKLLSEIDFEIDGLEQRMREEALSCRGIAMSPGLIGACSSRPRH